MFVRIPRTSAPRSSVVHALAVDRSDHVTVCGRRIGDGWAGEYNEAPTGPITCVRCLPHIDHDAALAVCYCSAVTGGHAVHCDDCSAPTDACVCSGEDYPYDMGNPVHRAEVKRHARLDATDAGTVRSVSHDDTGDTLAEWRGCVVGVRFTFAEDARAFLAGDRSSRPSSCRLEFGGYGACVRQASHGGQCADAHGYRFHGRRRTTIAEWRASDAFTEPDTADREALANAMDRHPAGKGRTLRDHRADSERAADGSERPPASVLLAFTRRGYTVRRAARAHGGWVIMAYRPLGLKDNGTYRYVVASIMEGDAEWTNGHYSLSPMSADRAFAGRVL